MQQKMSWRISIVLLACISKYSNQIKSNSVLFVNIAIPVSPSFMPLTFGRYSSSKLKSELILGT